MRGSSKILMALIAVVIFAAPFASAGGSKGLPTDKTPVISYKVVTFDGVVYRIFTEVPCDLYFSRIDDDHHRLTINPFGGKVTVLPFCEGMVQWGDFPPVTLDIVIGDSNSWILGTETGYAEK